MALALSTSAAAAAAAAAPGARGEGDDDEGLRRVGGVVGDEAGGGGGGREGRCGDDAGEGRVPRRPAAREVSWVPDPVTGHYRPSNFAGAHDAADLRAAHLARSYARA
ncbi:hypothetical protein OsJ_01152 [Oryza sativa Japonica Group]|uniref:Uncharacterized protein n=1 Tax=Oryza sativa subsp. japonica TaxID=39947 RepID=A2ZRE7_ORYSJ|nr:hypothetical protein OsJ_01152 [Oryza sativa Japonica Group]